MKKLAHLLPLLLFGCAQINRDVEPTTLAFNQSDLNDQQVSVAYNTLIDSASTSSAALRGLSDLANGEASIKMEVGDYDEYLFQSTYTPIGMEKEVDIKWNANFYPVLLTLADIGGYKVATPSSSPMGDLSIKIDTSASKQRYRVIDILRLINNTHKERLDIKIHEDLRVIEIIYL